MLQSLLLPFKEIGFSGFLDIIFMTLLIYTLLVWSKRTRAAFVLTGILIVAGVYLLARQFSLNLTAAIFEQFFAVILIALVVIFQGELRYFFERIAVWSLNRRILRKEMVRLTREEVEILVRTLTDLARDRTGALVVIRGNDMMVRHLEGGQECGGRLSEALLKSLFDSHSIGHDGAVVVKENLISKFSVQLPLSKNMKKLGNRGTRHAAALGLTELCDALCVVVSEERGTISITRNGEFTEIHKPEQLAQILEEFYRDINPKNDPKEWERPFQKNWRDKLIALSLSVALWFVLVNGSKTAYRTLSIPIEYSDLPAGLEVDAVLPQNVDVTFRGVRRSFYFIRQNQIEISVPLKPEKGPQRVRLGLGQMSFPKNLVLETIEPNLVEIVVGKAEKETPKPGN